MKQDTRERLMNSILLCGTGAGAITAYHFGYPLVCGMAVGYGVSYGVATKVMSLTTGKSDTSNFRSSPGSSLDRDFCKKFGDY